MRELSQDDRPGIDRAVTLDVLSGLGTLRLRSWLPECCRDDRPLNIAGCDFPRAVGAVQAGHVRLLCVGPGDWMVMASVPALTHFERQLAVPLRVHGIVTTDLSCSHAHVRVDGPAARDLLSKGCGLDLHPRSFPAGRCARTKFAQLGVLIESCGESDHFLVHVQRSYLFYLYSWLADAALEFEATRR